MLGLFCENCWKRYFVSTCFDKKRRTFSKGLFKEWAVCPILCRETAYAKDRKSCSKCRHLRGSFLWALTQAQHPLHTGDNYRLTLETRIKSLLTFGLVLCCSLLSSLSLCKRSNSSLISAAVLFRSTTCSKSNENQTITRQRLLRALQCWSSEALGAGCTDTLAQLLKANFNSQSLEQRTRARSKGRHERKPHALRERKMVLFPFPWQNQGKELSNHKYRTLQCSCYPQWSINCSTRCGHKNENNWMSLAWGKLIPQELCDFRLCWFTAAYLTLVREWVFYTGPVLEWIERVLDLALQNKIKSAKSS